MELHYSTSLLTVIPPTCTTKRTPRENACIVIQRSTCRKLGASTTGRINQQHSYHSSPRIFGVRTSFSTDLIQENDTESRLGKQSVSTLHLNEAQTNEHNSMNGLRVRVGNIAKKAGEIEARLNTTNEERAAGWCGGPIRTKKPLGTASIPD